LAIKHPLCAVKDCPRPGKPQICFYDGRYHHHGCIHYDCGYPKHSVEFRNDGWYWLCDEHYEMLKQERIAWHGGGVPHS